MCTIANVKKIFVDTHRKRFVNCLPVRRHLVVILFKTFPIISYSGINIMTSRVQCTGVYENKVNLLICYQWVFYMNCFISLLQDPTFRFLIRYRGIYNLCKTSMLSVVWLFLGFNHKQSIAKLTWLGWTKLSALGPSQPPAWCSHFASAPLGSDRPLPSLVLLSPWFIFSVHAS